MDPRVRTHHGRQRAPSLVQATLALILTRTLVLGARAAAAGGNFGQRGKAAANLGAVSRPLAVGGHQSPFAPATRRPLPGPGVLQPPVRGPNYPGPVHPGSFGHQPSPPGLVPAQEGRTEGGVAPVAPPWTTGDAIPEQARTVRLPSTGDQKVLLDRVGPSGRPLSVIAEEGEALATPAADKPHRASEGAALMTPSLGDRREALAEGIAGRGDPKSLPAGPPRQIPVGHTSAPQDDDCSGKPLALGGCYGVTQGFCGWVSDRIRQLGAHEVQERDEARQELIAAWNYLLSHVTVGGADGDVYFKMLVCLRKQMREASHSDDPEIAGQAQMFFTRLGMDPAADYPDSYHRHEY